MLKLFTRKQKAPKSDRVPQLSLWERRAYQSSGFGPLSLNDATIQSMLRDAMIQTCLTLKRQAVSASGFRILPADSSPAATDRVRFVQEAFARMHGSPHTVCDQALDALARGWSVQEIVWTLERGRLWIDSIRPKDPGLFGMEVDAFGGVRALLLRVPGEEERRLPAHQFVVYAHRRTYGRPRGRGDLEAVHPHWQAKQALLQAWKVHLERFAMPTVLGRYDRATPPEDREAMLSALRNLQDNTAIVCPSDIEIGTLGGERGPTSGFVEAIEFHNREMARAILGQTLTTDEGRRVGSLALGRVHLQVLLLQTNALRREIADSVFTEQIVRPLVELNFGPGLVPRFEFETSPVEAFGRGLAS